MSQITDLTAAARSSNIDGVSRLLEEVNRLHSNLERGGEVARHELVNKVRTLGQVLQTPRELMVQHTWADVRAGILAEKTSLARADARSKPYTRAAKVARFATASYSRGPTIL